VTSSTAPVPGPQVRVPALEDCRQRLGGLLRGGRAGHERPVPGGSGPTHGRCLAKLRILLLSQPDWSR
jgi:hypothetical protein